VRKLLSLAAPVACAGLLFVGAGAALAGGTSVNLTFDAPAGGPGGTGFDAVYSEIPTGYSLAGGRLTINTLPGDTFGDYENDPDSADNMFYSTIQPLGQTTVEARVRVSNLNVNFHGGGIWMGVDQDHYIRLGIFHNSFEGGVAGEGLRENQDLWPGNTPPGPGNDIVGRVIPGLATAPQTTPLDVILRLVRNGSTAQGFISTDNGTTFQQVGGPGFTFDTIVTGPGQGPNGGPSIEDGIFKVGVYAFGGPDGSTPAQFGFDSFTAESVPEPVSLGAFALGAVLALRRRARRIAE
jgi:hypothetical protein